MRNSNLYTEINQEQQVSLFSLHPSNIETLSISHKALQRQFHLCLLWHGYLNTGPLLCGYVIFWERYCFALFFFFLIRKRLMENLVILEILYSFPLNTVVCIWLAGHFEAGLPCISFQVKFFFFSNCFGLSFSLTKIIMIPDNIYWVFVMGQTLFKDYFISLHNNPVRQMLCFHFTDGKTESQRS